MRAGEKVLEQNSIFCPPLANRLSSMAERLASAAARLTRPQMNMPKWSLAALLSVMLFAALAAAGYRMFWSDAHPNALLWLAIFLAAATTATLGAWRGYPAVRRPSLGYAAFAWADLAVVLVLFGWQFESISDAERMAANSQAGMLLGLLAAIAATWLLPPQPAESR